MLWSLRLGGFLLYRVLKTGHDGRFDEMRVRFLVLPHFPIFSFSFPPFFPYLLYCTDVFPNEQSQFFKFMGFWAFQLFWVWIVSLPVTILNSPAVTSITEEVLALGGGEVAFGTSRVSSRFF